MIRGRFRSLLATVLVAAVPGFGLAQSGSGFVLRGWVTNSDGEPIQNATVSVSSDNHGPEQAVRTDSSGAYRLVLRPRTGEFTVSVRILGYSPQQRTASRSAGDSPELVVDFVLARQSQVLSAVRTSARRPRPVHDEPGLPPAPGANQATLDLTGGLSGDLSGDLTAALAMIPGVSLVPDASGGAPSISAFGLASDQNGQTLNGLDLGGGQLPRDGLVHTVRLSTYDPKIGRFSGLQVASYLPSGSYFRIASLHLTVDDPALQWSTPASAALGAQSRRLIGSGTMTGPITAGRSFYSIAYQLNRNTSDLVTLNSASASALRALGISSDSVARLLAIAAEIGLPLNSPRTTGSRTTTSGSLITRIDLTPGGQGSLTNSGTILYLLASTDFLDASGFGAGPTSLGSALGQSTHRGSQLSLDYSPYIGAALIETKSSLSTRDDRFLPDLNLPSATLLLNSTFPDGSGGFAPVQVGGNGGTASRASSSKWETSQEVSWKSLTGAHSFDVYVDAELNRFEQAHTPNRFGNFVYNSLADLASGSANTFTRTLSGLESAGQAWQGALALSDVYAVSSSARGGVPQSGNGLAIQYGVRADFEQFGERPAFNALVDSLLLRRTDHVPNTATVEPMVGFTWNDGVYTSRQGPATFTETRNSIFGGVREYRGTLSPLAIDNVAQRTGLASATQQISCIGGAVPTPTWGAYSQSTSSIPTACAAGSQGSALAEAAPPVTLFSPTFELPRSWRAELNWRWLFSGQLAGNLGVTDALNVGQQDTYDLNFSPVTRFSLASEDGRPVFVSPASIDPSSGAVAFRESRVSQDFGQVSELRSDMRSEYRQYTAGLTYRLGTSAFVSPSASNPPRFNATVRVWYTYAESRALAGGFSSTTGGDPRIATWAPGALPSHTIQVVLNGQLDRWFSISLAGRLSSGFRYTPRVGSDINGDGYANDRAFVFDPSTAPDPALASGMSHLLANAPRAATSCLLAQLRRIAAQNSCEGPWSASLGVIAIAVDPFRVGLGNRGSMTIYLNNALGGLDQLLHGSNHLQYWGQIALPDPTLLDVRGFDAASQRFLYTVNPLFGSSTVTNTSFRPPFRVTVDFKMDISQDRETQAITAFMRAGDPIRADLDADALKAQLLRVAGPSSGIGLATILRMSDSLALTQVQSDSISNLSKRLVSLRDSVYLELATFLVSRRGSYGGAEVRGVWHRSIGASIRNTYAIGARARGVLSDAQFAWLRSHGLTSTLEHSEDWLERTTRGPQLMPR